MRKVVRLTESDLVRIVKRVIKEGQESSNFEVWQRLFYNPSPGYALKLKITKRIDNVRVNGVIEGVKGHFEPELSHLSEPKQGHPFHMDIENGFFTLYLPKTDGEMEFGSGKLSELKLI